MKKVFLIFTVSASLVVTSCSKDGADGKTTLTKTTNASSTECPNGGTKIQVGLDANGNGELDADEVKASETKVVCNGPSVIYSEWYNFDHQDTGSRADQWKDSTIYNLKYLRATRDVPALTQQAVDGATILTYVKITDAHINLTPFRSEYTVPVTGGGTVQAYSQHNTIIKPGKLIHTTRRVVNNSFSDAENLINRVSFRYVIIPSSTTGRTDLKSKTYAEVARLFNIPSEGSNLR